jgi:uncharacterized Zn-finger protein
LGSLHLGTDAEIKAESEEALRDVKEELDVIEGRTETSSGSDYIKLLPSIYTTRGDPNSFPCTICTNPPVTYTRVRFLIDHMQKDHPEEKAAEKLLKVPSSETRITLTCARCGLGLKSTRELSAHMTKHNRNKFQCNTCGTILSSQVRLDSHVREMHQNAERPFGCKVAGCGKRFYKILYLRTHERIVHAPPPKDPNDLICKHCGKKTISIWALKTHIKLHAKTRKLCYCNICNEKLACPSSLRRHIKLIHLKDKNLDSAIVPESEIFL